jgi:hypothetical protein
MIEGFPNGEVTCEQLGAAPLVRSHASTRVPVSSAVLFQWVRAHSPLGPDWPIRKRSDANRLLDEEADGISRSAYFFPRRRLTSAAVVRQDTDHSIITHHHTIKRETVVGCTILRQSVEPEGDGSVWIQNAELRRPTNWHQWFGEGVGRRDAAQRVKEMEQAVRQMLHDFAARGA